MWHPMNFKERLLTIYDADHKSYLMIKSPKRCTSSVTLAEWVLGHIQMASVKTC